MLQLRTEGANQRFSSNKVQALNKPGVGVISSKINVLGWSTTKDPREDGKTISFIKYEEDNDLRLPAHKITPWTQGVN